MSYNEVDVCGSYLEMAFVLANYTMSKIFLLILEDMFCPKISSYLGHTFCLSNYSMSLC
jgi:hypothetical protein